MAMQVASLFGVLTLDDTQFRRNLDNARGGLDGLGGRMQAVGGQITRFGAGMTAATLPIAAGLGVAINASREFDRTMSNVFAITGQTGAAAANLRAQLLGFGGSTVAGPQRVAEAYYDIVSGVADASTHMAILEQSVRTAEAGQADLTATTSAMISAMNAYGLQAQDAGWVSDIFSRTVGMGVMSMDQMAAALPQATGLAAQFGIGLDEVGGSMAYMTTTGQSASQSATYLRSMISTLLNPTADLAEVITGLGYESGQAMLESEGLVGAYQILSQQGNGLAGLITNQEALAGGLLLSRDAATQFLAQYTTGIQGATEAAGNIQDQTEGWALLNSKLQEIAITSGDTLAPALLEMVNTSVIPAITAFTDWANQNPETFKSIMMVLGGVVLLGPAVAILGTTISGMGTIVSVANLALGGMPAKLLAVLGPIAAVALAIHGVNEALKNFHQHVGDAAEFARGELAPQIEAGLITREQIEANVFQQLQEQYGDLGARLAMGSSTLNIQGYIDQVFTGQQGQATMGQLWGFAGGGYTGDAPSGSVAGVVHAREYVVPEGGALVMRGQSGPSVEIGNLTINANDAAGGRAAADAFSQRLQDLMRANG